MEVVKAVRAASISESLRLQAAISEKVLNYTVVSSVSQRSTGHITTSSPAVIDET
jgi:hypothetical protein